MASASEWACKVCPCLNTMEQRAIVAQVWPLLPSEHANQASPQVLSMMPPEWFVLLFLIVLWRPSLPHTMKQRAIVAQVWPLLPSEHAKSVLASTQWNKEQSLLKYGLCFRVSMRSLSLPQHNETKSNRCSSMASASEWACKVCPCLNTMEQRAIVAQVWPLLPSECASQALILRCCQWSGMIRTIIPHSLVKAILASHNETKSNRCSSMASASEWACEVCPCLNTMEQRAIVALVWPPLPSERANQALVLRCCQWCLRNDSYYYSS